jgi:hypothetical protein
MKLKFANALSLALIVAMLFTSVALADNVQNDVVVGGNDTFTAGGSTTVNYRITANSGDGETGCNADLASPATVTINTPVGVTVDTSGTPGNQVTLTFTGCGAPLPATFSSGTPGNYAITVSVSDSGTGTYNTIPATFTLHVLAPSDSTAPIITPNVSGTLGNNGWYVSDVTVTWSVIDNESAISSSSGCGSTTINTDTSGTTLTCQATSTGGTNSESVTIKRDATAPTISGSAAPAANGAGWNNTDVAVSFTCGDNLSGIASCGPDATLSADGADQSASGTAVDNAGNTANATVSNIDIDKTKPTISAAAATSPNGAGWYNSDVTVQFTCNDALSGIPSGACPANQVLNTEGLAVSSTAQTVTDAADNTSDLSNVVTVKIDKIAPSVALVDGPANSASYYFGFVPASPTCSASDGLSGLAGACSMSGYSTAVGTHTVTASASDNAGNSASASATYTVLDWTLRGFYQPVDMSGVFNTVKNGSTVPLKFEIFAGTTELMDISAVDTLNVNRVACATGAVEDAIELTATGGTSLRYDATGGQFIYNWKTPTTAGLCYQVTLKTDDGSTLTAFFKLK